MGGWGDHRWGDPPLEPPIVPSGGHPHPPMLHPYALGGGVGCHPGEGEREGVAPGERFVLIALVPTLTPPSPLGGAHRGEEWVGIRRVERFLEDL